MGKLFFFFSSLFLIHSFIFLHTYKKSKLKNNFPIFVLSREAEEKEGKKVKVKQIKIEN